MLLGAIADDFTGATDLANTLVQNGMRVTQIIGVPDENTDIGQAEAVVIALKSRTAPVAQAVQQTVQALDWLLAQGAAQILFKYCSTFDSTAEGNIGPVADALRTRLGTDFAFVCPAFPANGRTIYQGHLFVGDRLLFESSMRDHPLTPMRDADLVRMMNAQSDGRAGLIPLSDVAAGPSAIAARVAQLKADGICYGVVDAVSNEDLRVIGIAAAGHKLITGGSGVAIGLPDNLRREGLICPASLPEPPEAPGRAAVLAGSCSAATRRQIAHVAQDWPTRKLDVDSIANGDPVTAETVEWALSQPADMPILIFGSADPEEVRATQERYGKLQAGLMMEETLGEIAVALRDEGFGRLVVAGGETSGAVVSALGITALRIGPEIAPGVPWTQALAPSGPALALKSGNFGQDDFFRRAFAAMLS
ncbi:four-carbon acid sugar kinase family protein [Paracoccus sp. EF6]|uniref:3-oxo-tetronate kinase n=1 Tax=Paracoccus benzoatiresistens TaxID=2997341 RepID=A0ABT4JB67_9RHOB|nr:four-carbon acid sugar kinase family protein [Paracoccus sp. EF6]